jgi:hypothetical protein
MLPQLTRHYCSGLRNASTAHTPVKTVRICRVKGRCPFGRTLDRHPCGNQHH